MRRDNENLCRDALRFAGVFSVTVVLSIFDFADKAILPDYDLGGDCPIPDRDIVGVGRVVKSNGWIVFRLYRTNRNAVCVARADAPALVGLGIARRRRVT